MKCRDCGGATRVLSTRPFEDAFLRRERECGKGHRFSTYEVLLGCTDMMKLKAAVVGMNIRARSYAVVEAVRQNPHLPATTLATMTNRHPTHIRRIRRELKGSP